jgi:ABC-type bacteriocin/lantibiotic exporter with double-glycine peptidase domain
MLCIFYLKALMNMAINALGANKTVILIAHRLKLTDEPNLLYFV